MMPNTSSKNSDLIRKLSRDCKEFYKAHNKQIIDIVLYGSFMRGKPDARDIDIIIIFSDVEKKEYLNLPYELRKIIEKNKITADVKGIYLDEIFDYKLLARTAIFHEGYSLITKEFLGKKIGFDNMTMFSYSLKNLSNTNKTRFIYALNGRRGSSGVLKILEGRHIGAGIILIPIQNSDEFGKFLTSWKINFEECRCLLKKAI